MKFFSSFFPFRQKVNQSPQQKETVCPLTIMKKKGGISIFLIAALVFSICIGLKHINLKQYLDYYLIHINKNEHGLRVYYYNNPDWKGDPIFSSVVEGVYLQKEVLINTNNPLLENFSIKWIGILSIPYSGRYKFTLISDDGSRLFLNEMPVVKNDDIHPEKKVSARINLRKCIYPIKIKYFQAKGEATISLLWKPSSNLGGIKGPIPLEFLHPVDLSFNQNVAEKLYRDVWKWNSMVYITLFILILSTLNLWTGFIKINRNYFFDRELLVFVPIYFFLSFIQLRVKLYLTPPWFDGTLIRNHNLLLDFDYTNNEQSRILQYYIPELFIRFFSLSIEHAYILQRWLFVFLVFICFHKYLRKWFSIEGSFSGVLFLAASLPLSYACDLQESSSLLLLTFLLGLWAIRENKIIPLLIVFFIGGLNNETMLILPLVFFFYNYKSLKLKELIVLCWKTFLLSLPLLLTIGLIRYITRDRPHLGGAWHLPDNLGGIKSHFHYKFLDLYSAGYLYIFFIFGIFWIYAFIGYKNKPLFLRRACLIIPFFIAAHLLTGCINEVRQMVPLSFIIIPMALFYIFPSSRKEYA